MFCITFHPALTGKQSSHFEDLINSSGVDCLHRFMWQDCVNKRLVVLNEPFFDLETIEKSKEILEGSGTFVPVKSKADQFLEPTPIIITSNTHIWAMNANAERPLRARCIDGYMKLVPANFLADIKKELHPLWLYLAMKEVGHDLVIDEEEGEESELNKSFEEANLDDE